MHVTAEVEAALIAAIAEHVPSSVLADVVAIQGIVSDFENIRKVAAEAPDRNAQAVARTVVEAYKAQDGLKPLVEALIRRDRSNGPFGSRIAELLLKNLETPPASGGGNGAAGETADEEPETTQEAALAIRAQMLRLPDLMRFIDENEGRLCVVAAESTLNGVTYCSLGTGFLVGPDLVLTASHVLRAHIVNGRQKDPSPGQRCVFFDHLMGPQVTDLNAPGGRMRRVDFDPVNWLQQQSDDWADDGQVAVPNAGQIEVLRNSLDMVLIKLAEPIGNYSRRSIGGARRGWFKLEPPATFQPPKVSDRIIIPQHPNGQPQQIDFGRLVVDQDASQTRIRYNTETERGTSGAPCFNQHFKLVGMHNAAYKPPGAPKKDWLNQAIRFDHILNRLAGCVLEPPLPSMLWSVSNDGPYQEVIVGRASLQKWIAAAADADAPKGPQQRIYAADGKLEHCGKTFTLRILEASRRDHSDRFVIMRRTQDRVPRNAADFMRLVAEQLRIPAELVAQIPPRPSLELPATSGDGDKLTRWLASDMPDWFQRTLRAHRVQIVDQRVEARKAVELFREKGLTPTREDLALSAATEPDEVPRTLWERTWIVLDDLTEDTFSPEVRELIAALTCVRVPDESIPDELQRLRWLFLGKTPDFLDGITIETLDQMNIPNEDIAVCVRAFAESADIHPSPAEINTGVGAVHLALRVAVLQALYADPKTRLSILQQVIAGLDFAFLRQ